jgi:hypothetical protein
MGQENGQHNIISKHMIHERRNYYGQVGEVDVKREGEIIMGTECLKSSPKVKDHPV